MTARAKSKNWTFRSTLNWQTSSCCRACASGNPSHSSTRPETPAPSTTRRNASGVAIVQGRATVGLGDGSTHDFQLGDMVLFEDVTGHGHTINWPEPSILCVMPLLNQ